MSNSGDGWMTFIVSVVALLLVGLFVAIGSSGDDEPTCTTDEHCEQQQDWREQDRIDRER